MGWGDRVSGHADREVCELCGRRDVPMRAVRSPKGAVRQVCANEYACFTEMASRAGTQGPGEHPR